MINNKKEMVEDIGCVRRQVCLLNVVIALFVLGENIILYIPKCTVHPPTTSSHTIIV
jgi:hypothetical protein